MSQIDNENNGRSLRTGQEQSTLPAYEPPRLTVMNEDEVLSAFQVPVVATTWWVM
jgi:hypothetical protein